jgi:hypothetical protein
MKQCPFCESMVDEFHPSSHVIPKWMHKLSFGKNSQTLNVEIDKGKIGIAQDGLKGSFICNACETQRFQKDDAYASAVFNVTRITGIPNIIDGNKTKVKTNLGEIDVIALNGLGFRQIQKFVIGVILREHMILSKDGGGLLGKAQFSSLRKLYIDESKQDDSTYPIEVHMINPLDERSKSVMQPYIGKDETGLEELITFMGGGYQFHTFLKKETPVKNCFSLNCDGNLTIPITNLTEEKWNEIFGLAEVLHRKRWGKMSFNA